MSGTLCPVCKSPKERYFLEGEPKLALVSRVTHETVRMVEVVVCGNCGSIYQREDAIRASDMTMAQLQG